MANCGILLNDGTSFLQINSGDFFLLNVSDCATEPGAGGGETPPAAPTIPPGGGSLDRHTHRGSLYWKRYQEQLRAKLPKKKKKKLDELDEALVELYARIAEQEVPEQVKQEASRIDRFAEVDAMNASVTAAQVQLQVRLVEAILREMDDEEIILLALH